MARDFTRLLIALSCAGWSGAASAEDGASRLSVEYHGDALSVEASGVPLAQVLAEIGAKAGFSVLEAGAPSTPVTVSIHRAAVADVLRQLLRGESHAVLYTASSEAAPGSPSKVARIVLLGRQGQPRVTDQPSHARGEEPPTQQPAPPVATLPALPGSTIEPLAMPAAAPATDSSVPAESTVPEGARVADMLRSLAVPGTQAPQASGDGAAADTTAQPGLDAVLAETTRRAQEGLSALMEGLTSATRSLQESTAAARR